MCEQALQGLICFADANPNLLAEVSKSLLAGKASSRLRGWLLRQLTDAPPAAAFLRYHIKLLQACNTALDLIKDVGFETALQYLAAQCLVSKQTSLDGQSSCASHDPNQQGSSIFNEETEAEAARLSADLVLDLSGKVCHLQLALACLEAIGAPSLVSFPKFRELVTVLDSLQQQKKSTSHSIVFVKERQSVHAITAMLRKVPELACVSFFAFTGFRPQLPCLKLASQGPVG